jgi:D-beta-D-heptose 7-phosphate kinase/D-beta-D-heptose 1-phosphate adenosyltransferase
MKMGKLAALLERFKGRSVVVVGDIMLDEYIFGKVSRISPEAPVPVVEVGSRRYILGGAANVANNIIAFGGTASLVGVIGDDEAGQTVLDLIKESGLNSQGIVACKDRKTSLKTRIIAHNQQVLRIDNETKMLISSDAGSLILEKTKNMVSEADAVLISDYAKGVISGRLVQDGIIAGVGDNTPIISDPKGSDYGKYKGVTLITPNCQEAQTASGIEILDAESLDRAGKMLLNKVECKAVLITMGEKGMSLYSHDAEPLHISATTSEVYDVTGAGDTVAGFLALGMAVGMNLKITAFLANYAAGLVVRKLGTSTVTLAEMIKSVEEDDQLGKIVDNLF